MDAATIADALDLKRYGGSWRGPCPACGGSEKATKFVVKQDGDTVLVHCHDCQDQLSIIRELRARGLWPDATPEQRQRYRTYKRQQEVESSRMWYLIADSAVARGESLTKRERQRYTLLKRLYGGAS